MDLAREHSGRGSGDDDLDLLGVQYPADEALPAGHELDLIEEPEDGLAPAQLGVTSKVLFEQEVELGQLEVGQPVVIEAEIDRPLGGHGRPALVQKLAQKYGLPSAAHSDHSVGLAGDRGQPGIAPGQRKWGRLGQGGAQFFGQNWMQAHVAMVKQRCPSVKDTFSETWP